MSYAICSMSAGSSVLLMIVDELDPVTMRDRSPIAEVVVARHDGGGAFVAVDGTSTGWRRVHAIDLGQPEGQ